nr:transcription termination/antitermination NusG family protein [Jiella sp. LLJ827]
MAERSADLGSKRRGWFAVRTNPRCEMMAFDGLERMGFEPWMPLCRRHVRRRYTKSRRTVLRPVLTGYLFVRMPVDKQGFTMAKSVNGVREVLGLKERGLKPLPGEEVERYRHFAESGVFDEARAKAHWRRNADHSGEVYTAGDSVRVKDGPYAGMKVVFGGYTSRQSAKIMLELFGMLRPVEIDPAALSGAN